METEYSLTSGVFYCPFCKAKNHKSEQLFILSEANAHGNTPFVTGGIPEFITCENPACRKPVSTALIIKGVYDGDDPGPYAGAIPYFLLAMTGSVLVLKLVFNWPLIFALIVGLLAGCIMGYIIWSAVSRVLKFILLIAMMSAATGTGAQGHGSYTDHIFNNPSVKWAAEYESLVNLTPKTNTISLKKYYLRLVQKSAVKTYRFDENGNPVTGRLILPGLATPEWLKDYYVSPSDNMAYWAFGYRKDHSGIRVLPELSGDSCCGCDQSDAFRVKQLLVYKDSRLLIQNVVLSPLCVRKKDEHLANWYPLGNFAYNTTTVRSAGAKYLTTSDVLYHINPRDSITDFKMVSEGNPDLAADLFEELRTGKLAAYDVETNVRIPYKKLLTWQMPSDTVVVYDVNGEPAGEQIVQKEIQPSDFGWIKVKQQWYFDFTSEKLYAEVASITLMQKIFSGSGSYIGMKPFCKLVSTKAKP
jgi:hypothetical protein